MSKIGLIGAGAFSDFCLDSYQKNLPGVTCAAVFDKDPSAATLLAKKFGISVVTNSIDELLAQEVDAILVLTRPDTHYELGKQVITAGKNVLIEKPMAFSVEKAEELIQLAEQYGCRITANLVLRYHPFHQTIRDFVQTQKYGKLESINCQARLAEYPADHWYWQAAISGGFFLNTYVHFLDLFVFVANKKPEKASHSGVVANGQKIQLKFANSTATLDINLHATNAEERVETIYKFEKATVTTTDWLPSKMIISAVGKESIISDVITKDERYQQILAAILNDLLNPITKPIISHQDLVEAIRVPLAAESNRTD